MTSVQFPQQFALARGVQKFGVRLANERAVLMLVAVNPGVSSAELARKSGLGAQTVSRILSDLEKAGFVRRGDVRRGLRGQPATPFFIDPASAFSIGCEIGWRGCRVQLLNMAGQRLGEHNWEYPFPDSQSIVADIAAAVSGLAGGLSEVERQRLIGIGIASPSGIARNLSLLGAKPEEAAAWERLDVPAKVAAATGLPTLAYNDGNAACWAELGSLPAPRPANFVYFMLGTFIGAGIVAESTLWEGPTGNSANLGSMIVTDRRGQQNFVHLVASVMAFETRLAAAGVATPAGGSETWDWDALEPHTSEWIGDAGRAIASAVANTSAVIELSIAIVDGLMPRPVLERLVDSIRGYVSELPALSEHRPTIAIGHRGADAASRGAALLPLYRRFYARDWEQFTK